MENFKVICKAPDRHSWQRFHIPTKVVTTGFLFWKTTKMVSDPQKTIGPGRDEICIVIETFTSGGTEYYKLAGYPYGGYDSKHFIRLDEFTESQKEIAEKAECALN